MTEKLPSSWLYMSKSIFAKISEKSHHDTLIIKKEIYHIQIVTNNVSPNNRKRGNHYGCRKQQPQQCFI